MKGINLSKSYFHIFMEHFAFTVLLKAVLKSLSTNKLTLWWSHSPKSSALSAGCPSGAHRGTFLVSGHCLEVGLHVPHWHHSSVTPGASSRPPWGQEDSEVTRKAGRSKHGALTTSVWSMAGAPCSGAGDGCPARGTRGSEAHTGQCLGWCLRSHWKAQIVYTNLIPFPSLVEAFPTLIINWNEEFTERFCFR